MRVSVSILVGLHDGEYGLAGVPGAEQHAYAVSRPAPALHDEVVVDGSGGVGFGEDAGVSDAEDVPQPAFGVLVGFERRDRVNVGVERGCDGRRQAQAGLVGRRGHVDQDAVRYCLGSRIAVDYSAEILHLVRAGEGFEDL